MTAPEPALPDLPDLVALARAGVAEAFGQLIEPHRRELLVHAHRMPGALAEADDAVQETCLRARRRLETYAGRASFRAWLYRIATNYCLDALDQRGRRTRPADHSAPADPAAPFAPPITEPLWLEPCPDDWLVGPALGPEARWAQREAVSLAFLAALHQLPPRQLLTQPGDIARSDFQYRGSACRWGQRASKVAHAIKQSTKQANAATFFSPSRQI